MKAINGETCSETIPISPNLQTQNDTIQHFSGLIFKLSESKRSLDSRHASPHTLNRICIEIREFITCKLWARNTEYPYTSRSNMEETREKIEAHKIQIVHPDKPGVLVHVAYMCAIVSAGAENSSNVRFFVRLACLCSHHEANQYIYYVRNTYHFD